MTSSQSLTQTIARTLSTGLLIATTIAAPQAWAENATLFTGPPPSAEELANMLFEKQDVSEPRTRSIVFINQDSQAAPQRMAKAPTQRSQKAAPKRKAKKSTPKRVAKAPAKRTERPERAKGFGFLINFALDSSQILPDSRPYLDQVGKMMNLPEAKGQKILIEGHTDARGSAEYNKHLSISRAQAVKEYLISKHNVEPQQLVTVGKGEYELLPDRSPIDGTNRRVEFYRADM